MPKICGLLPPRIHQTSLLTGYFSAPDNTGTSLRGNEGFLCTFFSLFDEGSVCVCRGHLRSPSEAGGGDFHFASRNRNSSSTYLLSRPFSQAERKVG